MNEATLAAVLAMEPSIEVSDNGLLIVATKGRYFVEWESITRVTAFKRDMLTFDLICLEFQSGGMIYEVNEEMPGFEEAVDKLGQSLPGIPANWLNEIADTPFDSTPTILYLK